MDSVFALTGSDINNKIKSHLSEIGLESYPNLNNKRVFKDCINLKIEKLFKDYKTVVVFCNKPVNWKIAVRTNIIYKNKISNNVAEDNSETQGLVLNTNLKKGEIIQDKDLTFKKISGSSGNGFFTVKEQLIGRKLKQNLKLGQIIKSRHLAQNWMIKKGQSVNINSNIGNIRVIMKGIAEENGHFHEIIKVSNISSGKIIEGIIMNEKKILIKN